MKHIKRFNENGNGNSGNIYDFYKSIFNSDDKSIVAAYFITKESDKSIEILNLKENINNSSIYMDGASPYTISSVERCILPKSQIEILGDVTNKKGFKYIKIPYWLFKKNDGLSIKRFNKKKRFDGAKTIEMLIGNKTKEYRVDYLSKMTSDDVENYLRASNDDELFNNQYTNFKRSADFYINRYD